MVANQKGFPPGNSLWPFLGWWVHMTLFNGESWPPTFGDEVRSRLGHHLVFTININLPFVCKYTIPVLGCPWDGFWDRINGDRINGVSQGILVGADFCWPSRPGECDRWKQRLGTLQRRRDLRLTKFDPTDVNEKCAVWKIPKVRKKFKVEGFLSIRNYLPGN